MKRKNHILLLGALLGLPAIAIAYSSFPPEDPIQIIDLEPWIKTWPTSAYTTNIGRAVSGDFTGDLSPDVWQMASNQLVLFIDPAYMDCTAEFTVNASSIARMPGATPLAKSRLLYSDANGVSVLDFDVEATNPLSSSSLVPSWTNVRSLACCDLDNDGHCDDLMAIREDGVKLLRLVWDESQNAYTNPGNIHLGSGATEAIPMIYNLNEVPQFAVLTPSWFFIVQPSGVRSKLMATNSAFGHIAKVTQVPSGSLQLPDCIVWLQEVSGGGAYQVQVVDSRATLQDPVVLTGVNALTICSGDVDGDGSDDFDVLSNDQEVHTYYNQRDADHLTIDRFIGADKHAFSIATVSGTVQNTSTPLLVDLNFDSKADLFTVDASLTPPIALAIQTDPPPSTAELVQMRIMGSDTPHGCFASGDFYSASYFHQNCTPGSTGETGLLMLTLRNPWGMNPTANLPGWKMDLVMYKQVSTASQINASAEVHYQYDLSGSPYDYHTEVPGTVPLDPTWSFPIMIPDYHALFHDKYYIILKPLPPNEGAPLTEYIVGVTVEDRAVATPSADYLAALPASWGATVEFELLEWDPVHCSTLASSSRKDAAGAVPLVQVPRYNGVPNPHQAQHPADPPAPFHPGS